MDGFLNIEIFEQLIQAHTKLNLPNNNLLANKQFQTKIIAFNSDLFWNKLYQILNRMHQRDNHSIFITKHTTFQKKTQKHQFYEDFIISIS